MQRLATRRAFRSSLGHLRYNSTATTPIKRRSVVDLTLLGIVGAGISGFLLYNRANRQRQEEESAMVNQEGKRGVFTVPVLSQTGDQTTKTLTLLSATETNSRLKEHEASYSVTRLSNPVYRYDTASLASNSPIEDDSCCVILERDPAGDLRGDLMFWGVFDGHSGWQTSKKVASSLVSYVARELDLVFRATRPYSDIYTSLVASSLVPPPPTPTKSTTSKWSLFSSSSPPKSEPPGVELDLVDPIIHIAIKNAFDSLDSDIVNAPLRLLAKNEKEGKLGLPRPRAGEMSPEQTEALNVLLPALSGSCALLALLDAGRNKLHVACTGDSRAVMGTYVPGPGGTGTWKAEALSEDQTGKSPSEVRRIKSEHPEEEEETVIARGRVLGGLEPSRAFGDSRYKWARGTVDRLAAAFHPGSIRSDPKNLITPPYVTARPEVVSFDLADSPDTRRFIVLATDGLYDRLSNEEVVSLVGAHLSGIRKTQSRPALASHISSTSPTTFLDPGHTHSPRQEPMRGEGDVWTFEDGNLATHLIRNALGGAKREQVSALLSIPAPWSRRYRDDITVTVILLGDVGPGGEGGVGGVHRRIDADLPPKAHM